jgi:hypothetical protein
MGRSRRYGKDGLSEYYMVAPLGFYILGNIMIPENLPMGLLEYQKMLLHLPQSFSP